MTHSPPIRSVIFDLDGTLHDRALSVLDFAKQQHARLGLFQFVQKEDWVSRFVELDADGLVWKDQVYQVLAAEISIPYSWQALLADYEANFPLHARLYPEAAETLSILKSRGLALGIITNGRTIFQQSVIKALGLDTIFDAILISEMEGIRKPEAEIFIRALQRLGVAEKEAIFVGDSPSADVVGAKNAGIYAVWKRNRPSLVLSENSNYIIDSLAEIVSMPRLNENVQSLPEYYS